MYGNDVSEGEMMTYIPFSVDLKAKESSASSINWDSQTIVLCHKVSKLTRSFLEAFWYASVMSLFVS